MQYAFFYFQVPKNVPYYIDSGENIVHFSLNMNVNETRWQNVIKK